MDLSSIFKLLRLDNLINSLTGYVETRVELLKIEVREEAVKIVSRGLAIGACFLFAALFLMVFSIGVSNYLNAQFGNTFTGYWIVSGSYALIFLVSILLRRNIGRVIERQLNEQAKQLKGK